MVLSLNSIIVLIVVIGLGEIGKKLDKGYKCPVYCAVEHTHYYWEQDETEKSNIPSDDELPGSDELELREQQKGSIRPVASID